jgi:hypothetical protein
MTMDAPARARAFPPVSPFFQDDNIERYLTSVDVPTIQGVRYFTDYRMANEQLQKSFLTTANGTDELSKLPGYTYYWYTDRFSMYNAYSLEPGPFRELLAVHTRLASLSLHG